MLNNKYDIRYLPIFYDDLYGAAKYIKEELKNQDAALMLVDKVEKAIMKRSYCAESFEAYPSNKKRKTPYYAIYVGNYIVFYVVIDHKVMEVRRLIYNGQDKDNMI